MKQNLITKLITSLINESGITFKKPPREFKFGDIDCLILEEYIDGIILFKRILISEKTIDLRLFINIIDDSVILTSWPAYDFLKINLANPNSLEELQKVIYNYFNLNKFIDPLSISQIISI